MEEGRRRGGGRVGEREREGGREGGGGGGGGLGLAVYVSHGWEVLVEMFLHECHGFHAKFHGVDSLVR